MGCAHMLFLFMFSTSCSRMSTVESWLVLMLLLLARVADTAKTGRDEVAILLQFKESAGYNLGGYWSTWSKSDETPCSWVGVTCTANSTVEQLNLSGWGMDYLEVADLSNLPDLQQLDLSGNKIGMRLMSATIPLAIGNLTGLTWLDLSRNSLTGGIPSSIASCRKLRYLSLEQNALSGGIPSLDGLEQLQVLRLSGNALSGPIPKKLGALTHLVSIDLSINRFNGTIPSFAKLTHLLTLTLGDNRLTGFEDPLNPVAKSVQELSVSGNLLVGSIPTAITSLLDLRVLDMSYNLLSGGIPEGFSKQMQSGLGFSLALSNNQLTGPIPPDLLQTGYPSSCVSVDLSYNQLTGNVPLTYTKFYCFTLLDLSFNNLSGPIPGNIFGDYYASIGSLRLQNNNLSGDIVDVLSYYSGLKNTKDLWLQNNRFTGDLARFANANVTVFALQYVDLSDNDLRMSASEGVTDPFNATLQKFMAGGNLLQFRVAGNNFSGTRLPQELSPMTASSQTLTVLDFSRCHLEGEISGAAFNNTWLPNLQVLNLSRNDLTGPVPESIVGFNILDGFDVTNNNLSGALPAIAPTSSLYNPSLFAGNAGLCGEPLLPCPSNITTPFRSNNTGVQWWLLLIIIGGSLAIALGSCLVATWRWTVYRKRHEQDADLIKTLMERDSATLMSLRELKKATDNFAQTTRIGEGGFGTVYAGKLDDGTKVAIKRSKREGSEKDKEQFLNEVRILCHVHHRYLVKLLGCCMENKIAVLVFEYVPNGTLKEHLHRDLGKAPLSWKQRLNIAVQTADALNYLHSAATFPIYHRDVKSANILLNDDLNAKVADFGISKLAPLQATHVSTAAVQGTMGYIDPEYYTSCKLTEKSDVYSFGVVLLELISAKPAIDFVRDEEETSLVNFASPQIARGDIQELIDPTLMETYNDLAGLGRESILNVGRLAMNCLDMRSKLRPSMNEVLQDLQNLWLELIGTSRRFDSIRKYENEIPNSWIQHSTAFQSMYSITDDEESRPYDHTDLLSASFSTNISSLTVTTDPGLIQMSPRSRLSDFRSRSMG